MKTVISYVMLIGFSLVGLWGVVRIGDSFLQTMCIQGPWEMEASSQVSRSACHERFQQAEPLRFSISQSGPKFSLFFNDESKPALQGDIQNIDVNATAPDLFDVSFANGGDVLRMRATLDRQTTPARLWGVLSFSDCPDLNFVAVSQVAPTSKAR